MSKIKKAFTRFKKKYLNQLHALLWILKDMFWCIELKPIAIFIGIVTITYSILVVYLKPTLLHIGISFWIVANFLWMWSDFYAVNLTPYYMTSFVLGTIFTALSVFRKYGSFHLTNKKL